MMAKFATISGQLILQRRTSLVLFLLSLAALVFVSDAAEINATMSTNSTCLSSEENIVKMARVGDDVELPCGESPESKKAMAMRTVVLWTAPRTWKRMGKTPSGSDYVIPIVLPKKEEGKKFDNSKQDKDGIVVNNMNSSLKLINVTLDDALKYQCGIFKGPKCLYRVIVRLNVVDRPGPPLNVTVIANEEKQLSISWMPGADHSTPIKRYYVDVSPKETPTSGTSNTRMIEVEHPSTEAIVDHLEPYKYYIIKVRAINEFGKSDWSKPVDHRTLEGKPTTRPTIKEIKTTNTTVTAESVGTYDNPRMYGKFAGLDARIQQGKVTKNETRVGPNTKFITFPNLTPFEKYKLSIRVRNGRHAGPWSSWDVQMKEGIPGPPRVFETKVLTSFSFRVRWEPPRNKHGEILGYVISVIEKQTKQEQILRSTDTTNNQLEISNLRAYTVYNVYVAATTKAGTGPRDGPQTVLTDVGAPFAPTLVQVRINTTSAGVAVDWNPPKNLLKPERTSYMLCWQQRMDSQQSCIHTQTLQPKQLGFIFVVSEPSVTHMDVPHTYRVIIPGQKLGKMLNDMRREGGSPNHLIFSVYGRVKGLYCESALNRNSASSQATRPQIGGTSGKTEQQCFKVGQKSHTMKLLITDEDYRRLMNGNTFGGARGSTGDSSVIILITILVLILVCVASFIAFFVACRRCGSHRGYDLALNNGLERINSVPTILTCGNTGGLLEADVLPSIVPYVDCGIPAVEAHAFPDHVSAGHADSEVGFSQEFDEIDKKQIIKNWPDTVARLPENAQKNRYTNIFPYDHTRVHLQNMGMKRSDYINANFIDGYDRKNAYIAAQGPMPSTFEDFWQMIWEQRTNTIVMISNLIERGRLKCDQYWPSGFGQEGSQQYGRILITLNRQVELAYYIYREMTVRNLKSKKCASKFRVLYHYQYTDWPDFAVPESPLPVLVFIKKTVSHIGKSTGPILVHCSAGVGRTGTYLCIESQIRQYEREKNFNVRGFLEHIRQMRMKLVQTEEQYAFIHDALLEHYLCPYHEIPRAELASYVKLLKEIEPCSCVRLEREYQLCVSYRPQNWELICSMKAVNESKSRSGIYPVFTREVALPAEPGVEGSNYINASYLQGYWRRDEFIVTQHPFEHTIIDFWKMVWDQNSSQIILLTGNMPNMEYPCFWPTNPDDTKEAGYLRVGFLQRRDYQHSTHLKFLVSSTREDYSLVSNMWLYKQWPSGTEGVMDLFHFIRQLQVERDKTGPFIVIDELGGSRAGIFCALNTLMDQLDHENCVDVYFVFKMYHRQRPGIFQCQADLEFIYDAIERYSREPPPPLPPAHSSNSSPATLPGTQENGPMCGGDTLPGRLTPNGVTLLADPNTVSFYSNGGGTLPRLMVTGINNGCATLDSRTSRDLSDHGADNGMS